MKVLIIGPFPYPIDGCSLANDILYKNLIKQKIVTGKINTNTEIVSSKQGHTFSLKKVFSFFSNYLKIFKIAQYDIIYVTPGQTFFGLMKYSPFIWLCQVLSKPYVMHVHGNYLGEQYSKLTCFKKALFKNLISHAAAGIVLSKSLLKNFNSLLPVSKIYVVENFVTNALYSAPQVKKTDHLRILYLSNLIQEKGILDLLDALLLLHKRSIDFKAVIAGSIDASIEAGIYLRLEKLKQKISYIGVISGNHKTDELWKANIFVLPTYYPMEGQPISLLEGLATGNIIITTRHSGIPDVIDETNGFFITAKSPESIAACLENIHGALLNYMNQYSQHNISYAASMFTEEKFTTRILNVIKKIHINTSHS